VNSLFTKVDYYEQVQDRDHGDHFGDSVLNSYNDNNDNQSENRIKISNFNNSNIVTSSPDNDEKNELVDIKHSGPIPNFTNQLRILIVESDADIRLLFKTYLESAGAKSITADNGDKALSIFQRDKNHGRNYDVVLIDTHLKGRRGLDVAKKIYIRSPNQRIVLLTTYMKEELSQAALDSAAIADKDILVMPFKLAQLRTVLNH
jgi:two-component system, OmpR family, response regulator